MGLGQRISRPTVTSGAALIALICLVAASTPATGSEVGGDQPSLAPAPQVSDLRVTPKQFSKADGEVTIRFSLDREGEVTLVRLRSAGTESGKGFVRVTDRPIAGKAGPNEDVVSIRQMGRRPGRYLLRAQTVSDDDGTGDFAAANYRIVR